MYSLCMYVPLQEWRALGRSSKLLCDAVRCCAVAEVFLLVLGPWSAGGGMWSSA